ncbi:MAG: putative chaperone protein DnaJ [Pseudomonadota bacterium]|jgi:DnaJ-domain-containing protein 1
MHKPTRPDLSFDFREPPRARVRGCDHPGCAEIGEHRAPKGRDRLNEYWWFCLDHVREYNKAWDFYAGMSEKEIESHLRDDTTWQRPTWPMGNWRAREEALRRQAFEGSFAFGGSWTGEEAPEAAAETRRRRARTPEEKALAELDLDPPADMAKVKARYRELVKLHHPDANGGDKGAEERLKRINQAYNTLKAALAAG